MRKYPCIAVVMLVLLSLAACAPFGGRNPVSAVEAATATPMPPTPIPPLVTPTGTVVQAMATPTFTVTPTPEPTSPPTLTPTPSPTSAPAETTANEATTGETTTTSTGETTTTSIGETTSTSTGETTTTSTEGQPAETTGSTAPATTGSVELPEGNLVRNGSFEEGFGADGVAQEWTAFSSDDGAVFAWESDSEPMHVSHGSHSQVMRIMGPGTPDTFVGVYQTIDVVPGATYNLALHGVIRSSLAGDDYDPLAFRVQYAIDESGGTDWQAVDWADWTDPGWNDVQLDVKWPPMDVHVIEYTPDTDKITLFVRGWSKWPFFRSEAKFYLDGIFVQGPMPAEGMPSTGGTAVWVPIAGLLVVVGLGIWQVRKRKA